MKLDVYRKSTAVFILEDLSVNGTVQNVVNDTITLIVKKNQLDDDADALITATMNVATYGASGKAYYVFTTDNLDIPKGGYPMTAKWVTSSNRTYFPFVGTLKVSETTYR